jgi:glucokinase
MAVTDYAAGIDIGATSIKIGLFNRDLDLVHRCDPVSTTALTSGDELVKQVWASVEGGIGQMKVGVADLAGIGIGSPGPLDILRGTILETPNMPLMNGYPLKGRLREAAGVPVWLDNDANVFVLGEAHRGAGKGYAYVLGVTLGTGFGWGIVLNGEVYHGATGTAAEYGTAVWKEEGHSWEEDVSIRGLMRVYREKGGTAETPEEVNRLASGGDRVAGEAWREYGRVLGLSLSHGVNMLDPHVLVIGGAMAKAWEHFHGAMLESLHRNIFTLPRENLKVVPSQLGDLAALYGAASQVEFPNP